MEGEIPARELRKPLEVFGVVELSHGPWTLTPQGWEVWEPWVWFNVRAGAQEDNTCFVFLAALFFLSPSTFSSLDLCFTIGQVNFCLTLPQKSLETK